MSSPDECSRRIGASITKQQQKLRKLRQTTTGFMNNLSFASAINWPGSHEAPEPHSRLTVLQLCALPTFVAGLL
ncbi:hypothetical protein [Pseudomonas caspiana]|uniref:hypothetical protein n=1 Tax=Pseudomonas caspiana TaxID=1451454 RepID=UPI001198215F|nr:hypothetical protein [Pseudomonas caspiana]